jgi:hypothetical protein
MIHNNHFHHTHDPGTFRYKNIVYISTDKCGGTYFENLFKTFGFEKIQQYEILSSDKIFTFIIDPTQRRIKSITQLIYNTQTQEFLKQKNFLKFIENICISDCHTYPYFLQYRHIADNTVFLPLDHKTLTPEILLKQYFAVHCPELAEKNFVVTDLYSNKADADKKAIYQKIGENLKPFFFDTVFQEDFELYKTTINSTTKDLSQHLISKYDK